MKKAAAELVTTYENMDWSPELDTQMAALIMVSYRIHNCIVDDELGDGQMFQYGDYLFYWVPERGIYDWNRKSVLLKVPAPRGSWRMK